MSGSLVAAHLHRSLCHFKQNEGNFQIIFVFGCEKGDNAASELKIAVLRETEQEKYPFPS
jgi:hypothetical protein